ncbi:hypothetical protein M3Y99_01692200 [Aphelenchoides fujianensis]|nr:hypothetical protein M3Y99_01692200 [Aphelenchoides fujianensis]
MPHARLLPSFLLLLLAVSTLDAHITLSFPPARHPPLDFLDTGRTHGPVRSAYTTLQTERDYNFTFRLQYPHQGGFRLKLLDYLGNEVEQLAPTKAVDDPVASNSFDGLDDQSLEWKQVRIQSMCPNCTIVLERQALEWGPSYKFHSCAQVHVVQSFPNEQQRCLNGGTWKDDRCECRVGFTGDFCQHKGECNSDEDCQNGGKCVPNGIFPNINSCFCPNGYFGSKCQEISVFQNPWPPFRTTNASTTSTANPPRPSFKYGLFEERCFKKFELTDEDVLYSRIVKDQLELILDFETNSYVSLGWRPAHIPKTCRLFPDLSQTVGQHQRGANTFRISFVLGSILFELQLGFQCNLP